MLFKHLLKYRYVPMIHFPSRGPTLSGKTVKLTNADALNLAIKQELQANKDVFLIGENVTRESGVSKGLKQQFGTERIQDTPVS